MYLRRKCYSSASNYDYYDYISDLALAERIFSDNDNRGLGAAVGIGAGGLGLAGLYGYAKSKDKAAANIVNAVRDGELSAKKGSLLLSKISTKNDLAREVSNLMKNRTGTEFANYMRSAGFDDSDIKKLFKKDTFKGTTADDWMNNIAMENLEVGTGKANKKILDKFKNAAILEKQDSLDAVNKQLERMDQVINRSKDPSKLGKDFINKYKSLTAQRDQTSRSISNLNVDDIVDWKKKLTNAEKAEKNTLLKRLRANKKMAAAAGIGGLAGLAGLGYMAGDNR